MNRDDLLPERMKLLNNEALEDFRIEDFNLKEKTFEAPNVKIKWIRILAEEQRLLAVLDEKTEEVKAAIMKERFSMQSVNQFKKELELDKAPEMVKMKKAISSQRDIIRFVEGIVKVAHGYGFDIKNCVDIVKLENS